MIGEWFSGSGSGSAFGSGFDSGTGEVLTFGPLKVKGLKRQNFPVLKTDHGSELDILSLRRQQNNVTKCRNFKLSQNIHSYGLAEIL